MGAKNRGAGQDQKLTEISGEDLARSCKITIRQVQRLADNGVFVRLGHGKYQWDGASNAFAEYRLQSDIARRDTPASKELYEAERARKLKLENDKNDFLLIETPEVLAAVDFIFGQVRTALSGVPARLSDEPAERRRVEKVLDTVLGEMADRFDKASADLQEGRDPFATNDEVDT